MTDHNPPQAPLLELPVAALHTRTHAEAHPDSEEAVRHENRRVSRELESIYHPSPSTPSTETSRASQATQSFASLRSRDVSLRSATPSHDDLGQDTPAVSRASTQPDIPRGSEHGARSVRSEGKVLHWYNPIMKFWTTQISLTIDEGAHRDHLALERTFLGYLRTSLILVMTGVVTAQLFQLQHTANPNSQFGFYVIGRPLSVTFIVMAIVVLLIGAIRFWRLQSGLVRGKALAGGWEVMLVMGLSILLLLGTFALVLGVDIDKTYFGGS